MKKERRSFKKFFKEFLTPDLPEPRYSLTASFPVLGENESERNHRSNVETMMSADLRLQWEAQRRTLVLVQRTALIAILSLLVSMLALAVAISR